MAPARQALLSSQFVLASSAVFFGNAVSLGPLIVTPLEALWMMLWTLGLCWNTTRLSPVAEVFGGLGLFCTSSMLGLLFFAICIGSGTISAEDSLRGGREVLAPRDVTFSPIAGWRMAGLTPAFCAQMALPCAPDVAVLAPLAGLLAFPALIDTPVLAYALLIPSLLSTHTTTWPLLLIVLGCGMAVTSANSRLTVGYAFILLGLCLYARQIGLSGAALAGAEAFVLTLAVGQPQRKNGFILAGLTFSGAPFQLIVLFYAFWLGLHATIALSALSPVWTAGCLALGIIMGATLVRSWFVAWDRRHATAGLQPPHHACIVSLLLGSLPAVCPGLFFQLVHPSLSLLSGVPNTSWRAWSLWVLSGGDTANLVPSLVFFAVAALMPFVAWRSPAPSHLPPWPAKQMRCRLSPFVKRALVWLRLGTRWVKGHGLMKKLGSLLSALSLPLSRHLVSLWLCLIGCALILIAWGRV